MSRKLVTGLRTLPYCRQPVLRRDYELACYLIATPQGHILINTGLAESAPMIRAHVEKLGFRFSDIKILLATHAHYDHVGAMAAIKKVTGAKNDDQ